MNKKRLTLKMIAGVGGAMLVAPKQWTKPIISSVVLPAHAQTSNCGTFAQDVFVPFPNGASCPVRPSGIYRTATARFINRSCQNIVIQSVTVSGPDDGNGTVWSLSTALPATVAVGNTVTLSFQSNPPFNCTLNPNGGAGPTIEGVVSTNAGNFNFRQRQ